VRNGAEPAKAGAPMGRGSLAPVGARPHAGRGATQITPGDRLDPVVINAGQMPGGW